VTGPQSHPGPGAETGFAVGDRLMPLDEALDVMTARLRPVVGTEAVALRAAPGRVLAADLTALCAHPGENRSAMDGYAVRHADLSPEAPVTLPVVARVAAGHPLTEPISPGAVARIFTGAVMPEGLDTVVIQEDTIKGPEAQVTLPPGGPGKLPKGKHVRYAGSDFRAGDPILAKGRRLRALDIALAASAGHATIPVFKRVRVGVFSTGDEVSEPGQPLGVGGVYDGNRYGIMAVLESLGAAVTDLGRLPDDAAVLRAALARAAGDYHVLTTSGGVSVGGEDHVRDVVSSLGALFFWKLAIRPGKPAALGHIGEAAFVGLPGNPVSAMVILLLVGRPVIQRLGGQTVTPPRRYVLPAGFHHPAPGERRAFLRAWIEDTADGAVIRLFGSQDSAAVSALGAAGGLVDLPAGSDAVVPGDPVSYLPFTEVLE